LKVGCRKKYTIVSGCILILTQSFFSMKRLLALDYRYNQENNIDFKERGHVPVPAPFGTNISAFLPHVMKWNYTASTTESTVSIGQGDKHLSEVRKYGESESFHLDLLVELKGDVGNHLLVIALAKVIQIYAVEQSPPIHLTMRFSDQGRLKCAITRDVMYECFPNLNREKVILDEFSEKKKFSVHHKMWNDQSRIIKKLYTNNTVFNKHSTPISDMLNMPRKSIEERLRYLNRILAKMSLTGKLIQTNDPSKPILSTPYFRVESFSLPPHNSKIYDELKEFLKLDENKCCAALPDPDESVLHIRDFATTLGAEKANEQGYAEASSTEITDQLLGHLGKGDKLAIVSKYDKTDFVDQLAERGIRARYISGQTSMQDFCFLQRAKKELIGVCKSTFFNWSSIFGEAEKVVSYSMRTSTSSSCSHLKNKTFRNRNFIYPEIHS